MAETVPPYTAAAIRAAEAPLLAAGEPLMRRAAAALAGVVRDTLPLPEAGARARILVLAGRGDNGGDALYAAADLTERADVDVLLTAGEGHGDALAAALAAGARQVDLAHMRDSEYDLVIDGIVGIGATGAALRGEAHDAVTTLLPAVLSGRTRVVAVDLPSGVQPDDGSTADGVLLPASVTVTFGGVKAGLTATRAPARVVFVELGLPLDPATAVGEADVEIYRA